MEIVATPDSNVKLPNGWPAIKTVEGNIVCFSVAFMPSKKDIDNMKEGRPIVLQVYKELPPAMLLTVNKDGGPNL